MVGVSGPGAAAMYHSERPGFKPLQIAGEPDLPAPSKHLDDDGLPRRTGTAWTASAHIITSVIGSGVLSLAWAIAQLGWIAGPVVILLFAIVTYYTSILLAYCYRSGDLVTGRRNRTYMDAVKANLSGMQFKVCGALQYANLFGTNIGYTIAASISMMAVAKANCFHRNGEGSPCKVPSNPYMIMFGVLEVFFSQIPDLDQIWWLSILAAVMSFTYSSIGLFLGILQVAKNGRMMGTLAGVGIFSASSTLTTAQKVWGTFQSLGDIAFAYSYSMILIEIQDTIGSPPSELKTMKKATRWSISITSIFYMACGCMGYAAFGNSSAGNLLTGFGFYNPYWLLDIANAAVVVHLVGAYQVFAQPLYGFVESYAAKKWPESKFITREIPVTSSFSVNPFRLVWRTALVVVTTVISMAMPFFNDVVGILGAIGFWPLTVYYPVEMYIVQMKVEKWSLKWIGLELLSFACLIVTLVALTGSVAGVVLDLKTYKPFHTDY